MESRPGSAELASVTFTYPGAPAPSLNGASVSINPGEFIALVGTNGCGKTTLCKTLNGLVPHFHHGDFSGEVTVCGIGTVAAGVSRLSREVGYVYQDFENQLLRPRVFEDVAFGPLNFGLADWRQRTETVLDTMNLNLLRNRFVWELSGGQKHLVALAGVLALDPAIVVVDEPVAMLDPANARLVYDRLRYINSVQGKTVIVIEHHPDFIAEFCTQVALMDRGEVRWVRPTAEALGRIDELEAHGLHPPQATQVYSLLNPGRPHPPLTAAAAAEALLADGFVFDRQDGGSEPAGNPGTQSDVTAGAAPGASETTEADLMKSGAPLVRFKSVTHRFPLMDGDDRVVLDTLDFEIHPGDRVALVGGNGAGKTTILRLIAGIIRPAAGTVTVAGQDTRRRLPEELAGTVSLVLQNPEEMFIADSVRGDILYYPASIGLPDSERLTDETVDRFCLRELADRDPRLLSGGQQRRVSLAIGAVMRPKLMMMDEPTSSLDIANRREVMATLGRIDEWVDAALIATHDMELVAQWAGRVVVLEEGRVIADGPPGSIFADDRLMRRARIQPPQVVELGRALGLDAPALSVQDLVGRLVRREHVETAG